MDDGDAQRVYVTMAGTLVDAARAGQSVEAGEEIGRLVEPKMLSAITELEGQLALQKQRLENLERRRITDPQLAQSIPAHRESVENLEQQLAQQKDNQQRLILRAPRAGTVLPPPRHDPPLVSGSLSTWSGSPLEKRNRLSYLKEGTVFCLVGTPHSHSATLMIRQDDIGLVQIGQRVRLRWNELPGETTTGEITQLASLEGTSISPAEIERLELPTRVHSSGRILPVGQWYRAHVRLDASEMLPPRGSAGRAKIEVAPSTLASRLIRWARQTFAL